MAFSVAQLRYGGGATAGEGGGRAIKCWVVFLGYLEFSPCPRCERDGETRAQDRPQDPVTTWAPPLAVFFFFTVIHSHLLSLIIITHTTTTIIPIPFPLLLPPPTSCRLFSRALLLLVLLLLLLQRRQEDRRFKGDESYWVGSLWVLLYKDLLVHFLLDVDKPRLQKNNKNKTNIFFRRWD